MRRGACDKLDLDEGDNDEDVNLKEFELRSV